MSLSGWAKCWCWWAVAVIAGSWIASVLALQPSSDAFFEGRVSSWGRGRSTSSSSSSSLSSPARTGWTFGMPRSDRSIVPPLFGWGGGGKDPRMDFEGANEKKTNKKSRDSPSQRHSYSGGDGDAGGRTRGGMTSPLRRLLPVIQTKKKELPSLSEFLDEQMMLEENEGIAELQPVLEAAAFGCQEISQLIQRAQTDELTGIANIDDRMNVQGEIQQQLDLICNTIMLDTLCSCDDVIDAVASEEMDLPQKCRDVLRKNTKLNETATANYVAVVDPIDGSKNIDVSLPLGTIFGVFRRLPDIELNETELELLKAGAGDDLNASQTFVDEMMPTPYDLEDYIEDDEDEEYVFFNDPNDNFSKDQFFLPKSGPIQRTDDLELIQDFLQRPDDAIVAGGYCLFSGSTVLVLTLGDRVDGFTLDPDGDEFYLTHPDIRIPLEGPIISFNEANTEDYEYPVQEYLYNQKRDIFSFNVRPTGRYIGALVADVHNVLFNGGIYGYPATSKNPKGKLRLLYEGCPMAMILEAAGGAASTGKGRILDIESDELHERTPMYLGSWDNIHELEVSLKYYGKGRNEDDELNVIDLADKKEADDDKEAHAGVDEEEYDSEEEKFYHYDEDYDEDDGYYEDEDDDEDDDDDYIPPWELLDIVDEEPTPVANTE